jgi:hypothetical protein
MMIDNEGLEYFIADEDTSIECLQVAPMGGNRVAILFLLSDSDYQTTVSVIFMVDDFEASSARAILVTNEWLTGLSAAPSGELFALEATVWIWRYSGADWTRDQLGNQSLRQIWAADPAGPIAVGANGVAFRLMGSTWQAVQPIGTSEYLDVHGDPDHGIYACGQMGAVHQLAGASWRPLEVHRHELFYGIDVAPDGTIRVAGEQGTCLRIANEEVTEIEPVEPLTHLAVRTYKGRSYWGDENGVNVEDGNALVPFEDTGIASDLRTDGEFLYTAGIDSAWRFDGKGWKTLTLVYEDGFRLQ